MPGYPKERHASSPVFVTRQTVLIVPAAPCREATATAAVRSSQRASEEVDAVGAASVSVAPVASAVEPAGTLGTGPASWALPPPQPATSKASTTAALIP